ncbi:alpha/beta hydrolase [Cellulomonas gilvus]|uniref:Alpha/beta hydrolase fold protein n=1 Tax=Cellulomonas gilvus (strain ATCC 13127 / NRRL B-14078) TaxID=593907 RepID=F8A4Q0_CELGA|nr:alpha/beta hydrolase [Cellulomonas gilvus]AEI10866.1 alpha/beta hydrolase fold protein [Cellulomonas gilvus ATCC 13127]
MPDDSTTTGTTTGTWVDDVLGSGFQARTLALADDDEGEVVTTLVRYRPPAGTALRPARALLYVHGWSDYFFQTGLAEHWHARGVAFYAVDLRKYGRSLREHQTPGYVDDLTTYDEDLDAALGVIRDELGPHARVMLMGHSTGGLVVSLWAARHPGAVSGMILNSPWLELQGSGLLRNLSTPAVAQLARFQPKAPLPNIDPGYYARTVGAATGGEWTYDERWRPTPSFPVRAGWLRAVMTGHTLVARGLRIDAPVLMLASARTLISPWWSEQMRSADVVLDVELLARRAVQLGPVVTVVRIPDGVHDLTLSAPPVRARFYAELDRWTAAYGWA